MQFSSLPQGLVRAGFTCKKLPSSCIPIYNQLVDQPSTPIFRREGASKTHSSPTLTPGCSLGAQGYVALQAGCIPLQPICKKDGRDPSAGIPPKAKLPPVKQGMGSDQLSSKAPPEETRQMLPLPGNSSASEAAAPAALLARISIPSSSPGMAQPPRASTACSSPAPELPSPVSRTRNPSTVHKQPRSGVLWCNPVSI